MKTLLTCIVVSLVSLDSLRAEETATARKTENVIFVMTDGLRWQEVFAGAEKSLMNKKPGGVHNEEQCMKNFWRETPEERRAAVLPFVWNEMAKRGQIFGNREKKCDMHVTNGLKFSYPGYSETFCGLVDPRIDKNEYGPNPNVSVLEWLGRKPGFEGRVAAFGAWDAFDRILNAGRCGFLVNAGFAPLAGEEKNPRVELLNRLKEEIPRTWDAEPVDALTFHTAFEYFKEHRPRLFYLSLGETDEWGHGGRYDEYLASARRSDEYVKILWETAQSLPQYRGKTTLVFSTDHGRGHGLTAWKDHGKDVEGAEFTWLAVLGPDTPALGERANLPAITQTQIAATIAALFGEDFCAAVPQSGKPIAEVVPVKK